jgi:hypothetical protein
MEAVTGTEAIQRRLLKPDLTVMDLDLPDITGVYRRS